MVITVTKVGGDGSVLARSVDTAQHPDSAQWTRMAEQAALHTPPQYRPRPGEAVYRIQAGGLVAIVAEQDLAGPLRELSLAVLTEGESRPA